MSNRISKADSLADEPGEVERYVTESLANWIADYEGILVRLPA